MPIDLCPDWDRARGRDVALMNIEKIARALKLSVSELMRDL
jgi:hypothetical protein